MIILVAKEIISASSTEIHFPNDIKTCKFEQTNTQKRQINKQTKNTIKLTENTLDWNIWSEQVTLSTRQLKQALNNTYYCIFKAGK